MKTKTLLLIGAAGVGGYLIYRQMQPAAASTTGMYVPGLGYNGGGGYGGGGGPPMPPWYRPRRRRYADYNSMQAPPGVSPWRFSNIEYGSPGGAPGWTPYSRAAAYGPSPVELESPSSLSFMASQIDAGF